MLTNYLKIAWRNLRKDKFYSLINILGLTIGVTCGLLLLLYVTDELSYDRYQANASRIYRIVSHITEPDKVNRWSSTQPPLAKTLKQDYPFVQNYVRFFPYGRMMFRQASFIPINYWRAISFLNRFGRTRVFLLGAALMCLCPGFVNSCRATLRYTL